MQTIATGSCSTFFSVNKYSDELMNERTFEVRKLNRYKTRWACLVFEPGDTERSWQTGCDFGRKFSSKKKAEKFGEHVLQLLSNQKEQ